MLAGPAVPVLALLRVGVTEPPGSPRTLVRSYRTVSPLPVRPPGHGPTNAIGGLLSVARSDRSPRPGSRQHPALWSPDFPRSGPAGAGVGPRPPGRLTVDAILPPFRPNRSPACPLKVA